MNLLGNQTLQSMLRSNAPSIFSKYTYLRYHKQNSLMRLTSLSSIIFITQCKLRCLKDKLTLELYSKPIFNDTKYNNPSKFIYVTKPIFNDIKFNNHQRLYMWTKYTRQLFTFDLTYLVSAPIVSNDPVMQIITKLNSLFIKNVFF